MLKQTFKWIDTSLAALLALVLGVLVGIYAWLSYQPRDVSQQIPALLSGVNDILTKKGYKLTLGKALIGNDGFAAPLTLKVTDVRLSNSGNQVLANIPELKLSPSLLGTLKGKAYAANIEVLGAEFAILQDAQGAFYLDTKEDIKPLRLDTLFFSKESEKATQLEEKDFSFDKLFEYGIANVKISDAKAQFHSEITGFKIDVPSLSIELKSVLVSEQINANLAANYINSKNQKALLQADILYDHTDKQIDATLNLHQFILSQFTAIDKSLKRLDVFPFALSGKARGGFNVANQTINQLKFDMNSPNFAELNMQGSVDGALNKLTILAQGHTGGFDLPFLKKHWPDAVGSDARRWVNSSVRAAKVKKMQFDVRLSPEILKQKPLPKEAVNAVLHIEDAVIDYVKGFPIVKNADGRVTFSGQSLTAEIDAIKMLSATRMKPTTDLLKARIHIPDVAQKNVRILLDVPLTAPVGDVIKFTNATPYKLPSSWPIDASATKGQMQGILSMKILDRVSPLEDEVDFSLKANLKNIAYQGLAKNADLSGLKGTLSADNDNVNSNFSGQFNGQEFKAKIAIGDGGDSYSYNGYLPISVVTLFAKELKPFLSGSAMVDGTMSSRGKSRSHIDVNLNTNNLAYNVPAAGLRKRSGSAGAVSATGNISGDLISLSKLNVNDSNIKFGGTLNLNMQSGKITSSRVDNLQIGKTKAKGDYALKGKKHHLTLNSKILDLESFKSNDNKPSKTLLQHLANIPDVKLNVAVDRLLFSKDNEMQKMLLKADCSNQRCKQFSFSANAGKTPISAEVGEVDGKRSFTANTPDLGGILRSVGVFEDLRKGALRINAVYQDDKPNSPMAGRVIVENFNARKIPVLAKLLTLATFTGILDSLSGGGMSFVKMEVPFQYGRNRLVVEKAKAVGPSIGITASGSIEVATDELSIDGVLIPAKLFDTILSDIPIIGNVYKAITGGEGLVAVNYSMKGDTDNPKVSVNPLSALTPGFLRDVFSMGGTSSKIEKQEAKETKEAIKAVESELQKLEDKSAEKNGETTESDKTPKRSLNPRRKD